MKFKRKLLKNLLLFMLFFNPIIFLAQETNENIDKLKTWSVQEYSSYSEKAIYDYYKLKSNKSRLINRVNILFKNNRIDENKYNEYNKRIENEEDILLKNCAEEIKKEINKMKVFCETIISTLYNTPHNKKIEYINTIIVENFAYNTEVEIKNFEIITKGYPESKPNNGEIYSEWTIKDYNNFVDKESEKCPNLINKEKDLAKDNFERSKRIIEGDKYKKESNNAPVDENKYKQDIKKAEDDYAIVLKELENFCEKQLEKNIKYRDEWVEYLTAYHIFVPIANNIYKAKEEKDKLLMKQILAFEESETIAKTKEILNSIEYKNWKSKYLSIIKSADANKLIINNLEKKYSFRNNYGNVVWSSDRMSKADKLSYNNNYEAIGKKLDDIRELQKIGRNKYYENLYADSVISLKTNGTDKGIELYNLSQYYNNHEKIY